MSQPPSVNVEGNRVERFMASGYGRLARALFGTMLVAAGLGLVARPWGLAVAALGLAPIAAGVLNLCPIAPLWGGHFLGSRYCGRIDAAAPAHTVNRR